MFVVDGSGSIEDQEKGNFQRAKDFIIEIVKSFNIEKDATQVALVLYNSKPDVVFKFKYNFDDIEEEIQEMDYPGGGTKTGKALDKVRNYVFKTLKKDREDLPKVVVVVTDGRSQDNVSVPAQQLRDDGATIISLGVGCCFDEDELNEMATDPDEKHVLEASFSELDKFKDAMKEQICAGELPARISWILCFNTGLLILVIFINNAKGVIINIIFIVIVVVIIVIIIIIIIIIVVIIKSIRRDTVKEAVVHEAS